MNKFLLLGLISLLTSILFIGVFQDDEFYEFGIFTKHKPSTKIHFFSTTGMSDLTLSDLSEEDRKQEIAFKEFVIKTGVQYPGNKYDLLPFLLIQLTLSLFSLGVFKLKFKRKFEKWLFSLHFIVNFLITSIAIGGIIDYANLSISILLGVIILSVNYLSIFKLKNQKIT